MHQTIVARRNTDLAKKQWRKIAGVAVDGGMAPLPQTSLNKGENDALRPYFWSPHPREEPLRALPAGFEGNTEAAQAEHSSSGHNQ
jgi:hypothetical protein